MSRVTGKLALALALALAPNACGGGSSPPPPPPPSMKLTILVPNYAIAGSPGPTLYVNGSGFATSSLIQWNGTPLATTFGTNQILSAPISNSLIANPGAAQITVKDGSAISNSLSFGIASSAAATAGVVEMITVASDGTPANGDSLIVPSISATGRYVAFQSAATNLAPGPASGYQEIYERDTCIGAPAGCTPTTIRITATSDGSAVNGHSRDSAVSGDGRYVAFDSSATNILPNSSACAPSSGFSCVFLRDTCTGAPSGCLPATIPVSVDVNGAIQKGGETAITPDGRFVVFASGAPNLVPSGTTGTNVFIRDMCNGVAGCTPVTTLISSSYNGAAPDGQSGPSAVNAGGTFVAFQSWASNIVSGETVEPGMFSADSCIGVSGCTPSTVRADLANDASQPNNNVTNDVTPAISADGRLVAFGSTATNLVTTNVNGEADVYVRDTCAGVSSACTPSTSLVSLANDGSIGNCQSPSQGLAMDASGRFVAFDSISTNLSPDDNFPACGYEDIFVRDTCFGAPSGCTQSTVRASVTNTPNPQTPGFSSSGLPAMSADGHYVVFLSAATNFTSPPSNGHQMVYLAKTGF